MGKVISTHTTSTTWSASTTAWFLWQNGDSTYYKTELKSAIFPTQSTWINVTYSSNWVDYSTSYAPTSYFKDTLGFVHLRIGCKTGASNPVANLPAGYIPSYNLAWPLYSYPSASSVVATVYITSSGGINITEATNTQVILGEVVFTP
jgi:hypothetical protein